MWQDLLSPFMLSSYLASALVGTACGFLSVYVILKRLVFLAVALAQLVSAAVALSFFLRINPTLAALGGVVLGALLFSWPALGRYLPRENAIGTSYALASAAGVLLIAKNAQGEEHLLNLLYGSVLTVPPGELWVMGGVVVVAGAVYLRYAKEFLFTSFDPEMARTLGVKTKLWEALFYVSLGLIIALAIHLGGIMLVFALLVMPGYAVLLARSRIRPAFCGAVTLAILAAVAGPALSLVWDLPTSAVSVGILGFFVIGGAITGNLRGLLETDRPPSQS